MNRLSDKQVIRELLNRDREWCLYALADLDDGMFEQCDWWSDGETLALVFRALEIRPILIVGDAGILASLKQPSGYLNLQVSQFETGRRFYRYRDRHEMHRMILGGFRPRPGATEVLSSRHRTEIEDLYATGDGGGIAFAPFQVETGYFRGVRAGRDLVAVAGVHVVSRNESVAGVGNIFVRSDHRGSGLAQLTTSAVVTALQDAGIQTIGLNVEHNNLPAIQAYEKLGFRARFSYFEGVADRIEPAPAAHS